MARGKKKSARLGIIVFILILAFCGYLALSSIQDKYDYDFGLPSPNLPIEDVLGEPPMPKPKELEEAPRETLEVHYLDVGQGESILIRGPEKTVLIDAGENEQGDLVVSYLREQEIEAIDYVIGTHPHADHIGGMAKVLGRMPVGDVILPVIPDDIVPATASYTRMLEAIADQDLMITPAEAGDTYPLGDGAVLTILGPVGEYDDLNNMSVVCRVDYGDTSFVFTGDAEKESEGDMLEAGHIQQATVLNLGHHGSKTSTSKSFLQAVAPQVTVLSCGQDNRYGHPHRDVVERVEEMGARVLRTDLDGTILLISDGKSIGIQVEK